MRTGSSNDQPGDATIKKTLGIIVLCVLGGLAALVTAVLILQVVLSLVAAE